MKKILISMLLLLVAGAWNAARAQEIVKGAALLTSADQISCSMGFQGDGQGNQNPARWFDDDPNTFSETRTDMMTSADDQKEVTFDLRKAVKGIYFGYVPRTNNGATVDYNDAAKDFTIYGSTDGENWTAIKAFTDFGGIKQELYESGLIQFEQEYSYLKFHFTANWSTRAGRWGKWDVDGDGTKDNFDGVKEGTHPVPYITFAEFQIWEATEVTHTWIKADAEELVTSGSQLSLPINKNANLNILLQRYTGATANYVEFGYNTANAATEEYKKDPHTDLIVHFNRPVENFMMSYLPRQDHNNLDTAGQWSDAPVDYIVYASADGENWEEIRTITGHTSVDTFLPVSDWHDGPTVQLGAYYEYVKLRFLNNFTHITSNGKPKGRWMYWQPAEWVTEYFEGSEAEAKGCTVGSNGTVQLVGVAPYIIVKEMAFFEMQDAEQPILVEGEDLVTEASQISFPFNDTMNAGNLFNRFTNDDGSAGGHIEFAFNTGNFNAAGKKDPRVEMVAHFNKPVSDFFFTYLPRQYGNDREGCNKWNDAPVDYTVFVSEDGEAWTEAATVTDHVNPTTIWPTEEWKTSPVIELGAEYEWVKLRFTKNYTQHSDNTQGNPKGRWVYWRNADATPNWEGSAAQAAGLTLEDGKDVQLLGIAPYICMNEIAFKTVSVKQAKTIKFSITDTETGEVYGIFSQKFITGTELTGIDQIEVPEEMIRDFFSYEFDPVTVSTTTNEIAIKATWAGPFKFSADEASASFYKLRNHDEGNAAAWHYLKYVEDPEAEEDYNPFTMADTEADNAEWAFVGSPYTGFAIINKNYPGKSLDEGQFVGSAKRILEGEFPEFVDGLKKVWTIGENTNGGFYILYSTGEAALRRTGSNNVSYWETYKSVTQNVGKKVLKGHQIRLNASFWAVDDNYVENYAEAVATDIAPWFDKVGELFYISEEANTVLGPKLAAALENCDDQTYAELFDAVKDRANFKLPENGKYYRICATNQWNEASADFTSFTLKPNGGGSSYAGFAASSVSKTNATQQAELKKLNTIFQYLEIEGGVGYFALYSPQGCGFLGDAGTLGAGGYHTRQATPQRLIIVPAAGGTAKIYTGGYDEPAQHTKADGTGELNKWGGENCYLLGNGASWTSNRSSTKNDNLFTFYEVEDVPVDLHVAGDGMSYSTLVMGCDWAVAETGAGAFSVAQDKADNNVAVLTRVKEVPAINGVVLRSDSGAETVKVKLLTSFNPVGFNASAPKTLLEGNLLGDAIAQDAFYESELLNSLQGSFKVDGSFDDLVLGEVDGKPGFYKAKDEITLNANRSFIPGGTYDTAGFKGLVIYDPTTGIAEVQNAAAEGAKFDLQGRRVQNAEKGVYVINGKKVLVK